MALRHRRAAQYPTPAQASEGVFGAAVVSAWRRGPGCSSVDVRAKARGPPRRPPCSHEVLSRKGVLAYSETGHREGRLKEGCHSKGETGTFQIGNYSDTNKGNTSISSDISNTNRSYFG